MDPRSDLATDAGSTPLEANVSICHINKVNPSHESKAIFSRSFGSSAENPATLSRKREEGLPRLSRKNSLELRIRGVKAEEKERTESTKRRIEYRPNRVEISSYGVTRARVYGVLSCERERERERDREENGGGRGGGDQGERDAARPIEGRPE